MIQFDTNGQDAAPVMTYTLHQNTGISSFEADIRTYDNLADKNAPADAGGQPYSIEIIRTVDTSHINAMITDHKSGTTRPYICQLHQEKDRWRIYYRGTNLAAHARPPHIAALAYHMKPIVTPDRSNVLTCPMPGNLVTMLVSTGDIVEAGQTLCIIEAMKMENALVAEKRCRIDSIDAKEGDILCVDALIMKFAETES